MKRKLISGKLFYEARFQRRDQPYSMVIEWCTERFGDPHRWPMGWHEPLPAHSWSHNAGSFFFSTESDCMQFMMRWL